MMTHYTSPLVIIFIIQFLIILFSCTINAQTTEDNGAGLPPPSPLVPMNPDTACGNGNDAQFRQCLADAQQKELTDCSPIDRASQADYYACACKVSGMVTQCYDQCPGQEAGRSIAASNQQSNCAAVERFKTRTRTTTTRTASSTGTGTPTDTMKSSSSSPTGTSGNNGNPTSTSNSSPGVRPSSLASVNNNSTVSHITPTIFALIMTTILVMITPFMTRFI